MSKRIVLIDGDIELYQITAMCQEEITTPDGEVVRGTDIEYAQEMLDNRIKQAIKRTKADEYIFCLTGDNNFRRKAFPAYKANRTGGKPEGYQELKDFTLENYKCKMIDVLEADDVIGIYCTGKTNKKREYIIYSIDKDMKTIPALQYDFKKDKIIRIDEFEANRFLFKQILIGDRVDGYTGVPKIGPKKSDRILGGCKTYKELVEATMGAYKKYYGEETFMDEFLMQARQARILHASDWDKENKKVIFWNPLGGLEDGQDTINSTN